jgi:N-acetylmuramoyl-L-alanine amidase
LSDLKIVIDAGHGGSEFGAIGCCRHYEKDINLAISKKIKHELQKNGATVYMTRETDNFLSLADRVKFIRNKNAIISLSIHSNALPDGADPIKRKGTSVFYYNNESKMLADKILKSMLLNLKTQDDKLRQASLALVRPTCALSVLIEVGYMINPEDYALLLDEKFQQKTAEAIVEGLKNFILNK